VAIRETAELKSEDYHLGKALLRLADPLGLEPPSLFSEHVSYPIVFAYFMHQWKVSVDDALMAFSWSWSENQIAAMIKLIPLGQTQGQKLMINMDSTVLKAVALAKATPVSKIGSSLPNLAILSSQHETQYSRLFRS
jgi:urease accessory protein